MASPSEASAAPALQENLIAILGAERLRAHPPLNAGLNLDLQQYLAYAEPLHTTVRVFYLTPYLQVSQLPRLLTHVPYICTGGDSYIETQKGNRYGSLEACKREEGPDHFLTNAERAFSRHKAAASFVKVFASGGYRAPLKVLQPDAFFDCVVVSGAGPQFEAVYLDYADLIITKNADGSVSDTRRPEFKTRWPGVPTTWPELAARSAVNEAKVVRAANAEHLPPTSSPPEFFLFSPTHALHVAAYMASLHACLHLWLTAFDQLVGSRAPGRRIGYFKLVAIGTGFFADVAYTSYNLGRVLMPLLRRVAIDVLLVNAATAYSHIAAVEFPDFTSTGAYTPPRSIPEIAGIRLVPAPGRDVLDFPSEVRERGYIPGVLNPGDCFSFVGNELSYGSVEAMIACNTTLRLNQNYVWNRHILDPATAVAVQAPGTEA